MRFCALLAGLALAGCAVLGPSINQSARAIGSYEGRPLDDLIARIGYPDRQERVADKIAYFWGQDHDDGPVCIWKAVAGADRIIIDTSVYGNIDGCERPTRMLQR
jgi:hypothetical protein